MPQDYYINKHKVIAHMIKNGKEIICAYNFNFEYGAQMKILGTSDLGGFELTCKSLFVFFLSCSTTFCFCQRT